TQNVSSQRTVAIKRLEEKVDSLQKQNDELLLENKKLHTLVASGNTRGGNCCDAIRQSLESVINTYQKLVSERDARIKQLEHDLLKIQVERLPGTVAEKSMWETGVTLTQDDLPDSTCRTTPESTKNTSLAAPRNCSATNTDSRSVNSVITDSGKLETESSIDVSPNGRVEKENTSLQLYTEEVSPTEERKLKLHKRDKKRKRFSEETSPDVKRTKSSTMLDTETPILGKQEDVRDTTMADMRVTHTADKDKHEVRKKQETCSTKNNSIRVSDKKDSRIAVIGSKVLASDTLGANTETGFSEVDGTFRKDGKGKSKIKKSIVDDTVLCIPETMAIEYDTDYNDDLEQGFKPDLSKIAEVTEHSVQASFASDRAKESRTKLARSMHSKDDVDYEDEEEEYVDNNDESLNVSAALKLIEGKDDSGKGNGTEISVNNSVNGKVTRRKDKDKHGESESCMEFSLRSELASPECEEPIKDKSDLLETEHNSKCSSKTYPSETMNESKAVPSQTFGKKKRNPQTPKIVGNSCKNMHEVEALFETPPKGDKRLTNEAGDVSMTRYSNRISNKCLISLNETEEVILRRSPRKHKSSLVRDKDLSKAGSKAISFEDAKVDIGQDMLGDIDDHDVTLAPEGHDKTVAINDENTNTCFDNQSVDFYNIVPVQNGVLNSSKTFQVKARRPKHCRSLDKNDMTGVCDDDKQMKSSEKNNAISDKKMHEINQYCNVTLKSPSLLQTSKLVRTNIPSNDNAGVVLSVEDPLRSPSVQSNESISESESPLLIKNTKKKHAKLHENLPNIGTMEGEKGSKIKESKTAKVNLRSSQSYEDLDQGQQKKKAGSRSKINTLTVESGESSHVQKLKNLHQTTLTQAFFSPKKTRKLIDDDKNLQLALKLSLAESSHKEPITIVDDVESEIRENIGKAVSPFKKPGPRKEGMSRKKKHALTSDQHADQGNSKILAQNAENRRHVLQEIKGEGHERNNMGLGNDVNVQRCCRENLNGSLDPEAELSELCKGPETFPSLDTDFCSEDLAHNSQSLPRTSTLAVDTQEIPCSSTSVKFPARRKVHKKIEDVENIVPDPALIQHMDDSFDRPHKKKTTADEVAHVAVVRKRDERQKLQGHDCKQCTEYYKAAGLSDMEAKHHMNKCSRHRAKFVPPDTPPHFWSVDFIDTQDLPETERTEAVPSHRRRRRLNKCFRSKNENSTIQAGESQESQDLDFG
ncbi:hypothetical protein DPMN_068804, partial [Dreissena polymorpha]